MTDTPQTPENEDENGPQRPVHDGPVISIEEEMQNSFMDYAMSVIVSRAIPDLRDFSMADCPPGCRLNTR